MRPSQAREILLGKRDMRPTAKWQLSTHSCHLLPTHCGRWLEAIANPPMLDFIWHLRGSVPMDSLGSNETALDGLERLLETQRKGVIERGPNFVTFDDPLWGNPLGSSWLSLVIYDRGRFWIEQDLGRRELRYDLRSLHGLVFCLFGGLMFFFVGLASGGLLGALKWAVGVFAWLYGMNILLAVARVPGAIRRAIQPA
jgi:hypothetical protein